MDATAAREMLHAGRVKKKSRKMKKMLAKLKQNVSKSKKKRKAVGFNYSAFHLLNDAQGMLSQNRSQLQIHCSVLPVPQVGI